ncbi:unnamed protein product [Arabidopsis halleri]
MIADFSRKDIVEEIPYPGSGSSRMDLKRSHHQWLTEASSSQVSSNKRQVVEIDALMNLSALDTSLVPTTHFTDCLFDPAIAHSSHLLRGRHYTEEQSIGLPVVHGSSFNLDTIRKVKVNQVSQSGNLPEFMVYGEGISTSFETLPSYNSGQESTLPFGQTCTTSIDKSFIRNFSNEGIGLVPTGDIFDKGDGNVLSTFQKGVENFVLMGQSLQKADCNIFSVSSSYNKGQENFMPLLSCDKLPGNVFMTGSNNYKENVNALSGGESPFTEGGEIMVSSQERTDQIRHEDRSQTLSFGDYQKESTMGSAVRVINGYENFSHDPAIAKDPPHMEAEENMSFEFRNPPYASPRVDTLLVPKSKDTKTAKKGSTNTFPSNVKSLLSTGMFDGVTVKYYSWSREKNLKGIIKGTGYLCGCGNCNFNRVLNAYEFEQHANCKTKHPNNHIYFENGKTIYGVVQELKNTPQEKLFDAIQNVTGSYINHKNFNTWKASYHVASLELQRIYGKDDVTLAS